MRTALIFVIAILLTCGNSDWALAQSPLKITNELLELNAAGINANSNFKVSGPKNLSIRDTRLNIKETPELLPLLQRGPIIFTLTLLVDSTLTLPLALQLTHDGASEIYLDGKLLRSFGKLDALHPVYYNPQDVPVPFFAAQGEHQLTIKYLNTAAVTNYKRYNQCYPGININIGRSDLMMLADHDRAVFYSATIFFMIGLFLALTIAHFFLYIYLKAQRSNLYFSLFCVSMASAFLIPYLNKITHAPDVMHINMYVEFASRAIFCIALSGFINDLFGTKRLRHHIITGLSTAAFLLSCIVPSIIHEVFAMVLLGVCTETTLLTVKAIVKKQPGARILGVGFIVFVAFLMTFTFIKIRLNISDADIAVHPSGHILMLLVMCAVLAMPVSMAVFLAFQYGRLNQSLINTNHRLRELISYNAHQMREPLTRITGALAIKEMFDDPAEFSNEILPLLEKAAKDLDNALVEVLNKVQE